MHAQDAVAAHPFYRIGVDVGDRSVGLAAIRFGADQVPTKILESLVVRHDGGADPDSGKTPRSRKAISGVKRRMRRMRKRRRQRLRALERCLAKDGFPQPPDHQKTPYDAWYARARLVAGRIEEPDKLKADLALALRHIARHRGWRNPWKSLASTRALPVPSETLLANQARAREQFGSEVTESTTVGQLGALAASNSYLLRPRNLVVTKNPGDKRNMAALDKADKELQKSKHPTAPILGWQIRQEDQIAEVERIWEVQGLNPVDLPHIIDLIFSQTRPYVPKENVGKDPLQTMLYRAPVASLEFQEFRIRAAVANLRLKNEGRRPLNAEERDTAFQLMWGWREKESLSWADVAEELGLAANVLAAPTSETDQRLATAPTNRTLGVLSEFFRSKTKDEAAKAWWNEASWSERSLLVQLIADPTGAVQVDADESGLSDRLREWGEDTVEALMDLDLPAGRAAYSTDTLARLNARMSMQLTDVYSAIQGEFGVDPTTIARPDWDEPTGQPTVDRVLTIVRRFVGGCERKYGPPESVVVEHVRTGLMGPEQRQAIMREISQNTRQNDRIRSELVADGIDNPTRNDVRRHRQVQRQNCLCLYCGATITTKTSELDHIVPRRGGGSSRGSNLVAVCRECNASKSSQPFAIWAESTGRESVSLVGARKRVKNWLGVPPGVKRDVLRRLSQRDGDDPIDERDLASTSYAATEIARRVAGHFGGGELVKVRVFGGAATREARRAGRVDHVVSLRGSRDKSRLDVRHHAIDAAVLTLLTPAIYRVLLTRRNLKWENEISGTRPDWKDYAGASVAEKVLFSRWQQSSLQLAHLIKSSIESNSIPVIRPLRLGRSRGAINQDTVYKLEYRELNGVWDEASIDRVIDSELHLALREQYRRTRYRKFEITDVEDHDLNLLRHSDSRVAMFDANAPSVLADRGVLRIGTSNHHARILTWRSRKGVQIGIQRVFAAEFPQILRESTNKDLFTAPIPECTMSQRDLQPTVRKAVEAGVTTQVGWLVPGDELELSIDEVSSAKNKLSGFLAELPESTWSIAGIKKSNTMVIRPLLLSAEGATADLSFDAVKVLEEGVEVSPAWLLGLPSTKVIRRTALGRPRWKDDGSGLPISFSVEERIRAIYQM